MNKMKTYSILAGVFLLGSAAADATPLGNAYFFGDSLTDCCVFGRYTNSNLPNWAKIISTVSSAEKGRIAENCGANQTIDYRTENVLTRLKELTDGKGRIRRSSWKRFSRFRPARRRQFP